MVLPADLALVVVAVMTPARPVPQDDAEDSEQ
jgi:hypothetical protein